MLTVFRDLGSRGCHECNPVSVVFISLLGWKQFISYDMCGFKLLLKVFPIHWLVKYIQWTKIPTVHKVRLLQKGKKMENNFQPKCFFIIVVMGSYESWLFPFCLVNYTWSKLQPTGQVPCSRTAHTAACIGKKIFIHGGMELVLHLMMCIH